jgi:hypothetical protein
VIAKEQKEPQFWTKYSITEETGFNIQTECPVIDFQAY